MSKRGPLRGTRQRHARAWVAGRRRVRARGIGGGERRLLAVVLIERARDDGAPDEASDEVSDEVALLPAIGSDRVEQLADGVTAVVIEARQQVASDQAARAARCALAIRELAPGRAMAIAMGRV